MRGCGTVANDPLRTFRDGTAIGGGCFGRLSEAECHARPAEVCGRGMGLNWGTTPRTLTGIVVASLFGAGTLSALWWTQNSIQAWAWGRTNLTASLIRSQPGVLSFVAIFTILTAFAFAVGGGAIYWAMRKFGRASAMNLLIAGAAACFVVWYAAQIGGLLTSGLPVSSDAGGVMVRAGVITAHGWEGAFRRSILAGAIGLAMAWVFCLVAGVKRTPS